jgi:hypothetical protein
LTEKQENELIGAFANCKDGPTRTRYQAVRLYGRVSYLGGSAGRPYPVVVGSCSLTSGSTYTQSIES